MKILVVDDDRILADVIGFTLRREGFDIVIAENGEDALERWSSDQPNLILLDVNLPDQNGFEVCRQIRELSEIPIILLTVRAEEEDIIFGLNQGADDYISKPFSPRQLVARVNAVLRRSKLTPPAATRKVGSLELNLNRHELNIDNRNLCALTALEYRLMDLLMVNTGQIVTTDMIIDYVWGPLGGDNDMVRQLVHRLRKKCKVDNSNIVLIENIPGVGYGLFVHQDES